MSRNKKSLTARLFTLCSAFFGASNLFVLFKKSPGIVFYDVFTGVAAEIDRELLCGAVVKTVSRDHAVLKSAVYHPVFRAEVRFPEIVAS